MIPVFTIMKDIGGRIQSVGYTNINHSNDKKQT